MKKRKEEPAILVCAPADAPLAVPGSVYIHRCAYCHARLMTAPSGQALLKRHRCQIICQTCYLKKHADIAPILATDRDAIIREVTSAKANPWNKRN